MAAGDPEDSHSRLGREASGNDLLESNCATKARTGDTEAIPVAPLTSPQS